MVRIIIILYASLFFFAIAIAEFSNKDDRVIFIVVLCSIFATLLLIFGLWGIYEVLRETKKAKLKRERLKLGIDLYSRSALFRSYNTGIQTPRIFISHSWEDNDIARKLAEHLREDGAEIWIDYARISGGDNLPEEIGKAIEWCDTMVLVWSKSANNSYYVKLEWTSALTNQKRIIPCIIDKVKLPTILSGFLFIDFGDIEEGYSSLARDLKLERKENTSTVKLRNQSMSLIKEDVSAMIEKYNFYDSLINREGGTFSNHFEIPGDKKGIIVDKLTALMWQQGGSLQSMKYEEAKRWVEGLNIKDFSEYKGWRLPTLEEAMSLMKRRKIPSFLLFIDYIFNKKQAHIWTSDFEKNTSRVWIVNYSAGTGNCYSSKFGSKHYIKAVRSLKI